MSSNKALLFTLPLLGLAACGGDRPATSQARREAPVMVQTLTLKPSEWPQSFEAPGTVRARVTATVSARTMGYVEQVFYREGDSVAAGALLARIDARDAETAVRQAEAAVSEARSARPEAESAIAAATAQLELAQSTHRRMRDLFEKRSISPHEMDEANARLRQAEATRSMAEARLRQLEDKIRQAEQALENARIRRGYAEVHAPFAGRIVERRVEPGNLAAPGAPLFLLEQAGGFRFEASVEESRIGAVRTGSQVSVALDAFAESFHGPVVEVVPLVDERSRSFIVKIDLPARNGLRAGLFGRAYFPSGARQVLAVPEAAIVSRGQLRSAFVVEEDQARARLVTLGAAREGVVEVLTGLVAGDRVIYPLPPNLRDGSRVEVRP